MESYHPILHRKERMIPSNTDAVPRPKARAALPNQNIPRSHHFTAKPLDA
jgi:hypothetical protein